MKSFFKTVLAVIVGIVIANVFMSVMILVMFSSMLATANIGTSVGNANVLKLSLNGVINEQRMEDSFMSFLGSTNNLQQGLDDIVEAIDEAADNNQIKGIYIEAGALAADYASAEEIRNTLLRFKKSGKFVVSYGDTYTQMAYYICSAADDVLLNPSGMLDLHGIAAQPTFYKDLLEKVGVKMQVYRVGTYKSAVEPFIATEMSEANREQVKSYIDDIWENLSTGITKSRNIAATQLDSIASSYSALRDPKELVKDKLVDKLTYLDEVRTLLREKAGGRLAFASPVALAAKRRSSKSGDRIAVYYAEGDIVDQPTASPLSGNFEIVASKVISDLDKLAEDDDVKAVVIRINSGGGSAYASEQLWRAVEQLKKKKTVVVSMGGLAASGGYYMACGAHCIYADRTTLTGSIGIFGMVPDVSGLLTERLGLHFDVVKTHEASDFGTISRALNAKEGAAMQSYVERGYDLFLTRVAAGRNMKKEAVDSIAQGRVWTGAQGLEIGLIDKIGSLEEAVNEAAARAKTSHYHIAHYPMPLPWYATAGAALQGDYFETQLREKLGTLYQPLRFAATLEGKDRLQARMPYLPNLN